MEDTTTLRGLIVAAFKESEMLPSQLAKLSGLQQYQLTQYMKGCKDLTGENIEKVLKVFDIDLSKLIN